MAVIKYINGYEIEEGEKFFIDANIWLYMYGPIGDYEQKVVDKYSTFFEKIVENGNEIYISSSLISEILNRYLKIAFKIASEEDGIKDFKRDFRDNEVYKETIKSIEMIIDEKIIKKCIQVNDEFETYDFNVSYLNNGMDFNDSLYCHMAISKGLTVLTNDKDFRKSALPVEIVTY